MIDVIPYSSIFIDVTMAQYFKFLASMFKTYDREQLQKMIEDVFVKDRKKEKVIASISVRTAFDLFLQAVEFPKGSEIIMTGINIPDMSTVALHNGLLPIPVNVNLGNLAPNLEDIKKAITPNTKAIMISYIFGVEYNIDELIKLCRKHNIYVLEDLAETFRTTDYNGHPDADLSLFSFGSIKYNTALAGALTVVRDEVMARKMKHIQEQYPIHPLPTYFKKIVKMFPALLILNSTFVNGTGRKLALAADFEYKEKCISLIRGFPKEGDFLEKFRFQVSDPMLANLAYRMTTFDNAEFRRRMDNLKFGQDILKKGGVTVVGGDVDDRSYWLFPIIVPDVNLCYKMLNDRGVDAYLGATQLKVVQPPFGSKYTELDATADYFEKILYLPLHKNVPKDAVKKICDITVEVINLVNQMKNAEHIKPKL